MRLQLIILTLLTLSFFDVAGQKAKKDDLPPAEIDFLFSYYQQDGDSSAVTGGQGTEELDDVASIIIVNIPFDYHKELKLELGVSYYTSASSDQINPNTISSASSHNLIFHGRGTKTIYDTTNNSSRSVGLHATHQFNFISVGAGTSFSKSTRDNNRTYTFSGNFTLDKWAPYYKLSKLYPYEIRYSSDPLPTDTRYSLDGTLTINQVINKKLQGMISVGLIYQWGLLSTPFHRVYFQEQENADLERLPDQRLRIPLAIRLNYYLSDLILLRSFYRFYTDNFGVHAHTIQLETPVKFTNFFSIYPYYRFYTQSASTYFAGYKTHSITDQYYTSDYDLSQFDAHMIGGGLRYSPPLGINHEKFSSNKTKTLFKSIEFRYGQYWRTNGLKAHIFSLNLSFLK